MSKKESKALKTSVLGENKNSVIFEIDIKTVIKTNVTVINNCD